MLRSLAAAVFAACLLPAHAADEKAVAETLARMQKLVPRMAGEWKGSGWVRNRDGLVAFTSEESIVPRVDGAVLAIEGRHRDARSGVVHHHAFGLIAWDAVRQEYRMMSALSDGKTGSFPMKELPDGRLQWTIAPERGPVVRYTLGLEPPGRWTEVGEASLDGGTTWTNFLEMKLERVGGASR